MRRVYYLPLIAILLCQGAGSAFQRQKRARRLPGAVTGSSYHLPNGWSITPAGEQIKVGEFPLALQLYADGKHLIISSNGYGMPSIDVINLFSKKS